MVKDPSPTNRLHRLGIRKATKKASAAIPAPKKSAITISLTKPRIRLRKVPIPMVVAALAILWFSDIKRSKTNALLITQISKDDCTDSPYRLDRILIYVIAFRNRCNQRFRSLESRKDLDTRYLKMLKKSMLPHTTLSTWERGR